MCTKRPVLTTVLLTAGAVAALGPAAALADPPPGRAYERVSPAEKPSGANGLSSRGLVMPGRSADVPDRVVYGLSAPVGSSASGASNTLTFGERTATGWRARTAVQSTDDGNTPIEVSVHEPRSAWMNADGRQLVFGVGRPLGWSPPIVFHEIYRTEDADVASTWLSEPTDGIPAAAGIDRATLAAGNDNRTVAFSSTARLTSDAPTAGVAAVYVQRDGQLQLASRLPDQSVPTVTAGMANGSASGPSRRRRNDVAGTGRFVLFRIGGSDIAAPLYVRDLAQGETRQLAGGGSQPDVATSLSDAASVTGSTVQPGLVFGARDAARAYFYGRTGTGSTATQAIYEANLDTGAVTARPAINGSPVGLSADGRRMLFLTSAGGGVRELRFWDATNPGSSTLLGGISSALSQTWGLVLVQEPSADGRTWVFTAAGSLDPDRPNATPAAQQLYRWTVGESAPTCLTCQPVDGAARSAGVRVTVQDGSFSETLLDPATPANPGEDVAFLAQPGHGLSEDGRWLLFDSPDRLVAEDHNDVRDVYLWDRDGAPGGKLQLVTSGQGDRPSWALDLSPDGTNAFFSTREGLVPSDKDGAYDVYTARIGTGFPRSPESCVGEACRPAVIPPPPTGSIGSGTGVAPSAGESRPVQQGSPKLRVRSVRTSSSRLTVRVDTPKAGRIRISGARVKTTSRSAKRQTTYTLRVPLRASAKRLVARGRTVKVNLRVAFTPQGSKKATAVRSSVSVRKGR